MVFFYRLSYGMPSGNCEEFLAIFAESRSEADIVADKKASIFKGGWYGLGGALLGSYNPGLRREYLAPGEATPATFEQWKSWYITNPKCWTAYAFKVVEEYEKSL